MGITKKDVLELRRRLKKTECTFSRMCGCYVDGSKNVVLKFGEPFLDLEDEEFYKYLEIAKKALSGSLGSNLLELEFRRDEDAAERQQFFMALKGSKLKNDELLDRLYEQVIEHYSYAGNYLILVYHDIYDVMTRTSDNNKLDESEEIYEYMIGAVCPVELSKPGLGYQEEQNRIGVRERDWVVGLPDVGFLYPAFSGRGSDIHAVMYYVKNGKESHPEFVTDVLGCEAQRTAAEEKRTFHAIVKEAFGEDGEQADQALLKMQKTISALVIESEEEGGAAPVRLTRETVAGVIDEAEVPEEVRERIEQRYGALFGDTPPAAQNLVDKKAVEESARRERTAELEQKVSALQERLRQKDEPADDGAAPWDETPAAAEPADEIVLRLPEDKAAGVETRVLEGQKCIVIPVEDGATANINGVRQKI